MLQFGAHSTSHGVYHQAMWTAQLQAEQRKKKIHHELPKRCHSSEALSWLDTLPTESPILFSFISSYGSFLYVWATARLPTWKLELHIALGTAALRVFKNQVSFLISCYSLWWEKPAHCSRWVGFSRQSTPHPWAMWEEQRLPRDGCLWFSPRRWLLHARWPGKDWIYN